MARASAAPNLGRATLNHFIAGFIAVLLFHQGMFAFLHAVGFLPNAPFTYAATKPFGVPVIWSQAFWGGVWGLVYGVAIEPRWPSGVARYVAALIFGALALTLVGWFVVSPLKGLPVAAGWVPARMSVGLMLNGAWGVGVALLLRWRA